MATDKTNNLTAFLNDLADGIRVAETGSATPDNNDIPAQNFRSRIEALNLSTQTADADAAAGDILSGKTAYVDGTKVTGTMPTPARGTTSITVAADDTNDKLTITASNTQPKGYNTDTSAKTKTTTVTLTASGKTVTATATDGTKVSKAVATGSAKTPATTITANPSLSTTLTEGSGYKMSVSATKSITPTVSAGYVSSGTAGTITVSGSAYVPAGGCTVDGGELIAGDGVAAATGTGITLGTATTTKPTSGKYITVQGSGSVSREAITDTHTAGYIPAKSATTVSDATSLSSNTKTVYYPISSNIVDTSAGDATAANILSGKKAYVDGKLVTGSMTNNGAVTKALDTSTTSYTISSGYHNGSGKVSISLEEKTATPTTSAQTITPSSGKVLSKVTVAAVPTQTKTATPTTSSQTISPDSGKFLSAVTVNAIPSNYVIPSGSIDITKSGETSVSGYATAKVAAASFEVSGASVKTKSTGGGYVAASTTVGTIPSGSVSLSNVSITNSFSGPTYNSSTGKYDITASGSSTISPSVTAGYVSSVSSKTASASGTKSLDKATFSTSGRTVSVSKSGYIEAGTTAGTVSSSYIVPSGTKTISSSGTHDVKSYASASVAKGSVSTPSEVTITPSFGSPTYNSSTGKYDIATSGGTIVTPSVDTAGWVTSSEVNSNTVSVSGTNSLAKATFSTSGRTVSVATSGYIESGTTAGSISTGSCSVSGGGLTSGSGAVSATGTNVTLTELSAAPSSGAYITVTGSGSVSRAAITKTQSAGYISSGTSTTSRATSKSSNTATKYYAIATNDDIYLYGVYQFISTPTGSGLSYNWSQIVSEPITFGWTGTTSGSPGTVYENICNTMKVQYGSYGLVIWYGSDVAYTNTTYGGISSYTGWQAIDGVGSTTTRTIIITTPYRISSSSAFYRWFSNNTEKVDDWNGGTGGGGSDAPDIETSTVTISRYGSDPYGYSGKTDFYYTAFENGAIVAKHTSSNTANRVILNNVVVNTYLTYNCAGGVAISPNSGASWVEDIRFTGSQMAMIFEITGTSATFSSYADCCFEGTSQILMADGTTKNLSEISIGEKLITYNEQTGVNEINEVTALGTADVNHNTIIVLEDDTIIQMNKYHPMWTEDGWKSIVGHRNLPKLTEADKLMNNNGDYIAIKSIEEVEIDTTTYYTIKVVNNNNFYVNGYLAQGKEKD